MKFYALAFVTLYLAVSAHAQEYPSFVLTKEGIQPIEISFSSMTASSLYNRTLHWVETYYDHPSRVIKTNTPNTEIRVETRKDKAYFYGGIHFYDLEYALHAVFKEEKIVLSFIPIHDFYHGRTTRMYWGKSYPASDYSIWFDKNGQMTSKFQDIKGSYEETMNTLVTSLCNSLKN